MRILTIQIHDGSETLDVLKANIDAESKMSEDELRRWFLMLVGLGINFHPDDSGASIMKYGTNERFFTDAGSRLYDQMMTRAIESLGDKVYEIGAELLGEAFGKPKGTKEPADFNPLKDAMAALETVLKNLDPGMIELKEPDFFTNGNYPGEGPLFDLAFQTALALRQQLARIKSVVEDY